MMELLHITTNQHKICIVKIFLQLELLIASSTLTFQPIKTSWMHILSYEIEIIMTCQLVQLLAWTRLTIVDPKDVAIRNILIEVLSYFGSRSYFSQQNYNQLCLQAKPERLSSAIKHIKTFYQKHRNLEQVKPPYGSRCSRMDQVKLVEDSLKKI